VRVRKTAFDWRRRLRRGWKPLLGGGAVVAVSLGAYAMLAHSAWFTLRSSGQITIRGAQHAAAARIQQVFAADLGRNVFFIPLNARRQAIEALPWVEQAAVLRVWPATLEVQIRERTPVAYARVGEHLSLVDAHGVLLPRPAQGSFDFPVLIGLAGVEAAQPNAPRWLADRAAQVAQWLDLAHAMDENGSHSHQVSEVDVSDAGDLRARLSLPGGGTVLVHFGDQNFAARTALFQAQIAAWRQKYPYLTSVDLHFDGQAIVDPGTAPAPAAPAPKPPAAKPAGKKSAARTAHGGGR
jgi:cell division protein FtsQ